MTARSQDSTVIVHAPARLHLGIIDLEGGLGRRYGSIGVALHQPRTVVLLKRVQGRTITIQGEPKDRARRLVELFMEHFKIKDGFKVTIEEAIPEHVGLGSGTQLSLALGTAVGTLMSKAIDTQTLAHLAGRGVVSGIGTAVFQHGGFVIDGGVQIPVGGDVTGSQEMIRIPPVIVRHDVPEDWTFVVALPNIPQGLSGGVEQAAFNQLPKVQSEQVGAISRLVLMQLLPALVQDDIGNFGKALTVIQRLVGDCFVSAQDGRFASPVVAKCITVMLEAGAFGAGQSSWGPACYGLTRGATKIAAIQKAVTRVLNESTGGAVFTSTVNNQGAHITIKQ